MKFEDIMPAFRCGEMIKRKDVTYKFQEYSRVFDTPNSIPINSILSDDWEVVPKKYTFTKDEVRMAWASITNNGFDIFQQLCDKLGLE